MGLDPQITTNTDFESAYRLTRHQHEVRQWCEQRLAEAAPTARRRTIPTSAGETHVLESTPSDSDRGRPVVIVPGTNSNAATSLRLFEAVAATHRTIVLDVPGQPGLSAPMRAHRDRLDWYGRWLTEVLEQVAPEGASVLGHSLGGAIVLASDSPLIAKRVLVSPGGIVSLRLGAATMIATMAWLMHPSARGSGALLRQLFGPGHRVPEDLIDWYTLVASHARSSLAPPVLPDDVLGRAASDATIVVAGEHDTFLPPARLAGPVRSRLGVTVHVVAGAGHLSVDEEPAAVAAFAM